MRISDWSSDVCSSDLVALAGETVMAGLSCGDPSPLAWEILAAGADDFVAVDDSLVAPAMKSLADGVDGDRPVVAGESGVRSEEHTSELQSLMRISYAVFCLKKKQITTTYTSLL